MTLKISSYADIIGKQNPAPCGNKMRENIIYPD
nr:MAG TPA: hypothetical protein [Caudoviricetes sp.]